MEYHSARDLPGAALAIRQQRNTEGSVLYLVDGSDQVCESVACNERRVSGRPVGNEAGVLPVSFSCQGWPEVVGGRIRSTGGGWGSSDGGWRLNAGSGRPTDAPWGRALVQDQDSQMDG